MVSLIAYLDDHEDSLEGSSGEVEQADCIDTFDGKKQCPSTVRKHYQPRTVGAEIANTINARSPRGSS